MKDLRECHSRRPVLLVRCWAVEQGPGGGGRRSRLKPENVAGAHAGRTWEQDLSPSPEGASSPGSSREVEEAQAALARRIEGEYLGATPRRKFLCSRRERWGEGWWGGGARMKVPTTHTSNVKILDRDVRLEFVEIPSREAANSSGFKAGGA